MKKKKLNKVLKNTLIEYFEKIDLPTRVELKRKTYEDDFNFVESTDEIRKKIRNLITRLSRKRDDVYFNINESTINISRGEPKYFHIEIYKGTGYNIVSDSKRTLIKDIDLYDDVISKIKEAFDSSNLENFNDIYLSIMKENGLNRDQNLDHLNIF